jgi:hypothetical protein
LKAKTNLNKSNQYTKKVVKELALKQPKAQNGKSNKGLFREQYDYLTFVNNKGIFHQGKIHDILHINH